MKWLVWFVILDAGFLLGYFVGVAIASKAAVEEQSERERIWRRYGSTDRARGPA